MNPPFTAFFDLKLFLSVAIRLFFKSLLSVSIIWVVLISHVPSSSYAELNPLNKYVRNKHKYPELANKILKIITYIQNFELDKTTPLHRELFGLGKDGNVYLKLFDEFNGFIPGYYPDPTIFAYAHPDFPVVVINISTLEIEDLPLVASFFVHEALHFKNKFKVRPHAICPQNGLDGIAITSRLTGESFEGLAACDRNHNGAYAYQAVMLNNLARFCNNCSENDKKRFSEYANDFRRRIIDPENFQIISNDFIDPGQNAIY